MIDGLQVSIARSIWIYKRIFRVELAIVNDDLRLLIAELLLLIIFNKATAFETMPPATGLCYKA